MDAILTPKRVTLKCPFGHIWVGKHCGGVGQQHRDLGLAPALCTWTRMFGVGFILFIYLFSVQNVNRFLSSLHPWKLKGLLANKPGTITPAFLSRHINHVQENKRLSSFLVEIPWQSCLGKSQYRVTASLAYAVLPEGNCRPLAGARKISAYKAGNTSFTQVTVYS